MNRKQRRAESKHGKSAPTSASSAVQQKLVTALQHHQAGRLEEAERLYRQVLALDPRQADGLHLLGVVAHQSGRHDLAVEMIGRAVAINATEASYHSNLGVALKHLGRLDDAVACYRRALDLWPEFPDAHNGLGSALGELGRPDEAAACFRRALDLRPDFPEAHNNLGTVWQELGRLDAAVACYRQALGLRPDYVEAHDNLGNVLRVQGRPAEAAACFRQALRLRPAYPEAHYDLALLLLAQGDMAAGWPEYEWRWQTPEMATARRSFATPQWRGEPAEGRTLLIHAEQGFGDTIQFCRYAGLAAARGWRVVLEVQPPLVRLLRSLTGVDQVVARGGELPPFDFHCPMLSLPLAVGTTVATIPGDTPYLHADAAQVAVWRTRAASLPTPGVRVGLAWAGNPRRESPALAAVDRRRSIAPERLAPLLALPGVHFFSLQKDGPAAPGGLPLTDAMNDMTDFADTAALIASLDLVISVDTAVAHLAAALGRPVWLLDRFDPCWRWLTGRRDSPWYPTLRLYRQPHPGDWDSVIAEVGGDLRRFAAG